jgi:hypothetical protein
MSRRGAARSRYIGAMSRGAARSRYIGAMSRRTGSCPSISAPAASSPASPSNHWSPMRMAGSSLIPRERSRSTF